MHVEISDQGALGKRMTINYTPAEVSARRETILKRLAGEVNLKGFRPGKSAKGLIEKRYGDAASAKLEEELANEGFNKAVTEHKLKPIGPVRSADRKRADGLSLTVEFEIKPPVTLPEPASIAVTKDEVTIADAEVDEAVKALARRAGSLSDLADDETIAADDSVTLTGTVTCAGKVAREFTDLHHLVGAYPLMGKDAADVVAAFKDQKSGAQLSFTTTLPSSFKPEEFAGKQADISFTVKKVQRIRPAALDDELAKKMGLADFAALSQAIRDNLKRTRENEQHQRQLDEMMTDLVAKTQVELPPKLLENLVAERRTAALAKSEQLEGEAKEKAKQEAEQSAKSGAVEALKRFLVLDAIAETCQVKVTREDLDQQIQLAASRSGQKPDDIAKKLWESGRINDVIQEIREAKALETMLDRVLGRETPAEAGEVVEEHVHGPDCKHDHAHG
jgi:trigger factor